MYTEENRTVFSVPQNLSSRRKRAAHQNADNQLVTKHLEKASEVLQHLAARSTLQEKQQMSDGPSFVKLRKLSPRARLLLQNKIHNLVFEAELQDFDARTHSHSISTPTCSHSTTPRSFSTYSLSPSPTSPLYVQPLTP